MVNNLYNGESRKYSGSYLFSPEQHNYTGYILDQFQEPYTYLRNATISGNSMMFYFAWDEDIRVQVCKQKPGYTYQYSKKENPKCMDARRVQIRITLEDDGSIKSEVDLDTLPDLKAPS